MTLLDDAVRDLYGDLEIDGRVLDMGESNAGRFDVPPDELVAGDPRDFEDASFDAVLLSNGELPDFDEVARVLRPGGYFVLTFAGSDDDAARVRIVRSRFAATDAFGPAESDLRTSLTGTGDRLWAVWARRR
ncbi:MAG TPA: methyltransferase domain-containing protein [Solirubrobacter sp.]|nr:methyltransferase domain-containing protein [Solirubrobacter sp.]